MSGVEGLLIGAAIGLAVNLLTNGINPVLQIARTTKRCEQECRKLADTLESIKGDVQHIKGQLEELQGYDPNAMRDLRVLVNSMDKLNEQVHLADIEVHECDSASKLGKKLGGLGGHSRALSKKITARNETITGLGKELINANISLTAMLKDARRSSLDGHQHQAPNLQQHQQMLQHRPSMDLHQWYRDVDDIQQRAGSTRHLERLQSESLPHSGFGSTSSGSSPLYADDSSHHSFHHLNHTDGFHQSQTIASTHPHVPVGVPHMHRSSTDPSFDHMTHSEDVRVPLQDPFVPHLLLH